MSDFNAKKQAYTDAVELTKVALTSASPNISHPDVPKNIGKLTETLYNKLFELAKDTGAFD